ncbi:MAG: LPS assembly lipoprotein LptE [Chitinispirillaceae bacterium]|jgi:hypothetical protein|nr:LPS assembly lipoprotein LptE [Chitinispirillaceae bacterium]
MAKKKLLLTLVLSVFFGCIYSFTGSSLPAHLKSVEIPLFSNQSMEPTIADEITQSISREIVSGNLLKVVERNGSAIISGTVTAYANTPYTFGASTTRQIDVQQYVVRITVDVDFKDNRKNVSIYKGIVTGEGIYSLEKENEKAGQQKAIKELVQRIMQNSVQGW